MNSLKALFVTSLIILGANACLLLPRSESHFAKLLAVGTLAAIGLCYYGIKFLPFYSIHSAAEIVEPGDVVLIPPEFRQRIRNVGQSDLVFLAICTPRFVQNAYEDLESTG